MTISAPPVQPHPASPVSSEKLDDFFAALAPRLAGGSLRTDAMTRALYATDASLYQVEPLGVLVPQHADEVQAAVEEARRFGVPVLPRGSGTSLAGQTVGAALVVDCSKHLGRILHVDAEAGRVRIEPGIVLDHLNAALRPHGLMVGPDPAPSNRATLGGMMANNATGTHSILYGNLIRHVRGARALLADGSLVDFGPLSPAAWAERTRRDGREGELYRQIDTLLGTKADVIERDTPKHWRRNSGYRIEYLLPSGDGTSERNLAQLLCGSEGTLAVATEIELDLVRRPERSVLGVVHFETTDQALRAVTSILETEPSAVELFDGHAIDAARHAPGFAQKLTFLDGRPGAVLITEYAGHDEKELLGKLDRLDRTRAGYAVVRVLTPEQIQNVWTVRKEGLGLIMGVKGDHKPVAFIEDASVPVEHLADYVSELEHVLADTQTDAVFYAHASAGCLHIRPFINTKDAREVKKMEAIAHSSMELVRKHGGAVSSEHGDGRARSWLTPGLLGDDLYTVYREVKSIFDPEGLLNPHNIVDAPPMTEQLRMGPGYTTIPVLTEMDWSEDGGFARAVEMCNGNGACRKLQSGMMCPSFMVTKEEAHSTRGRANALRAAMSGLLPPEALTGPALYEVMDLCIQCKGCKTECPSNVDMGKMKTEWLNTYWKANGLPLRTRLFAHLPTLTRKLPKRMAAVVNRVNRLGPVRRAMEKTLGISARRPLPTFASEPFTDWFRKQRWTSEGPPVVLFADTFNNYNHPETAKAAAIFLHRAGYHVLVPDASACCGRPLLSKGLLDDAKRTALHAVEQLYPYAERSLPIIGLEPSCILTFVDETLSLFPADVRARKIAEVAVTFEAFVAEEAASGALEHLRWKEAQRHVLLHGHCHQKALIGTGPAARCLGLPGYTVETVDSGCCGMAGAFGYEAEHYDVSIKMAERRLAPAVRAQAEDALIVAAGTSCRAQIHDTTGRHALHPAEVLLGALEGEVGKSERKG